MNPAAHRYRQPRAVCQVISGVNGLAESEDRWDLEEGSVKTWSMVKYGMIVRVDVHGEMCDLV